MLDAIQTWKPPAALGPVPETLADPLVDMLWGVTDKTVREWLRSEDGDGASQQRTRRVSLLPPGSCQARARVILSLGQLNEVQEGDVLICRLTAPSWAPVFPRIKAAVTDVGGLMAHAAIVAREYGLPAVVGTGIGTTVIETGQMVEVNGARGTVRILS